MAVAWFVGTGAGIDDGEAAAAAGPVGSDGGGSEAGARGAGDSGASDGPGLNDTGTMVTDGAAEAAGDGLAAAVAALFASAANGAKESVLPRGRLPGEPAAASAVGVATGGRAVVVAVATGGGAASATSIAPATSMAPAPAEAKVSTTSTAR